MESLNVSKKLSKIVANEWELAFVTNRLVHFIYEKILNKKVPEEAFSAGLLHNIGIIFMIHLYKETYIGLNDVDNLFSDEFLEKELESYGVTHQEVGGYLMKWWELPFAIVEVGLYHHNPLNPNIINQELVAAVNIASMYAYDVIGGSKKIFVKPEVFALLRVSKSEFEKKLKLLYVN